MQALETAIARGRVYLEGVYPHLVATYDVAMVAYALALTDSDHAAAANTKLKTLSRYNIGTSCYDIDRCHNMIVPAISLFWVEVVRMRQSSVHANQNNWFSQKNDLSGWRACHKSYPEQRYAGTIISPHRG